MIKSSSSTKSTRRLAWLGLLLIVAITVAIVALPVWIVQPFKPQTRSGLEWSYLMRRWSPVVTLISVLASLGLFYWLWRNTTRWWRKAVLVIALLPMFVGAWFARQNHFEWMFNPLVAAAYAKAEEATYVANDDVVLAVNNNGESVAYPVRLMAYHHLVQDVVGGSPIVSTY